MDIGWNRNMRLSIISFTGSGAELSEKIAAALKEADRAAGIELFSKCAACKEDGRFRFVEKRIGEWAGEQMKERNALLFIGACGIAVRAVAPHITDKLHDSPVLVMDEKGRFVIPILSGHMGGANELALFIAEKTGAQPVITTATDVNGTFAVDIFAKRNGLFIANKEGIARVSSKALAGKNLTVAVEPGHLRKADSLPEGIHMTGYPPTQQTDIVITSEEREFDAALLLRPREYVVGMGCRRGKEAEKIEALVMGSIAALGISAMQIAALASIDVKSNEPGLLAWSRKAGIPFVTYTAEELRSVEGNFHESSFVKEKVGVDNVCERAALRACGPEGRLVYEKHGEDGMTIAIAKREWRVSFDEA